MSETQTQTKPYKETLEKVLYTQDYETTSQSWNTYPTNRVKVELVKYEWETLVKWQVQAYEGTKVVITNSKLQIQDGNNVIKQKVRKTSYWDKIVNDETQVKLSMDEFTNLLKEFHKKPE